jgi:LPXTG-site transpeptidase (sortase) family protein
MPVLPLFSDIDQRSWYAPYIETGFRMGVVKGYPDGTFKPADQVTVEEAIALMLRVYKQDNPSATYQTSQYIKNQPNQWYSAPVSIAIQKNIIMHDLILQPGMPVTRGQLFDMLYRLREAQMKNIASFPESRAQTVVTNQVTPRARSLPTSAYGQYASQKSFAITMPSLGIMDLTITHPSDPFTSKGILSVLDVGVGHLFSYPGEGGKIMVYGHSSGYPWDISEYTKIFRKINELQIGDRAYVTYNGKIYVYEVTQHATVAVDDSTSFQPDKDGEELILYTCWPPDTVDQRYLVFLKPVESVAAR